MRPPPPLPAVAAPTPHGPLQLTAMCVSFGNVYAQADTRIELDIERIAHEETAAKMIESQNALEVHGNHTGLARTHHLL